MVFRWSIWGEEVILGCEVLAASLGSFRRSFGADARYVVCTDNPEAVAAWLRGAAEVVPMHGPLHEIRAHTVWQKWAPAVRLLPDDVEIYVDIDVFVVGEPWELRDFCEGRSPCDFLAMSESLPDPALYGAFKERVPAGMPQINAGLVGQRAGADLTGDFNRELAWWREHVGFSGLGLFPDEQGAVAASLAPHHRAGRLGVLPAERYRIVSPRSNGTLRELGGTALIHATQKGHPAMAWFREAIVGSAVCRA